jgi:predicted transcriptional regulator
MHGRWAFDSPCGVLDLSNLAGIDRALLVITLGPSTARFIDVWRTGNSSSDSLHFESAAALFRVLTPKRWELIERLQSMGPNSMRALARALERDVKRVHEDIGDLKRCGLVARTEDGTFHIPYDLIHADFDLRAVA